MKQRFSFVLTPRISHLCSSRGLTFVELLMAATMFSIMAVGLTGHLRGAIEVWRRTIATAEGLQRTRVVASRLTQDLASAFDFDPTPEGVLLPAMQCDRHRLAFLTTSPAFGQEAVGRRAWFVTYEAQDHRLVITRQTLREARADAERPGSFPGVRAVLVDPIDEWMIAYGYVGTRGGKPIIVWKSTWDKQRLPGLIEAALTLPGAAHEVIRSVFVIPAGVLPRLQEASG